jgi:hypothetical protein
MHALAFRMVGPFVVLWWRTGWYWQILGSYAYSRYGYLGRFQQAVSGSTVTFLFVPRVPQQPQLVISVQERSPFDGCVFRPGLSSATVQSQLPSYSASDPNQNSHTALQLDTGAGRLLTVPWDSAVLSLYQKTGYCPRLSHAT